MNNQTIALVQVTLFKQGTVLDKNGNQAVYLNALAGNIPSDARVVTGTGAQFVFGMEVGKTYTILCDHVSTNEAGQKQYNYTVLDAADFEPIFKARQLAGTPVKTRTTSNVTSNVQEPVTEDAEGWDA